MPTKFTPMPGNWRGRAKKGGGGSPTEDRNYGAHPAVAEMHKKNRMARKIRELNKLHPEHKYSMEEVANKKGNKINIIRKTKREK